MIEVPYREGDWTDRQCDGCGRSVAATSKVARVLCVACHPVPLPLGPSAERQLTERADAEDQ